MSNFIRITDTHGWIGRISWWNTSDQQWVRPSELGWRAPWRIWGCAPIWCNGGWGPPLNWRRRGG